MTTTKDYDQKIIRDAEYFMLVAMNNWLKMEKIKKQDKDILGRRTEEAVNQWIFMKRTERIIFLNRVLYEYWVKANTRFDTYFAYRKFISSKAEEIRQKQQYSSESKYNTGSTGTTDHKIDTQLAKAYAVLGLPMNSSQHEIKRAYRVLVKKYHPDHGGDAQRFIIVQAAYEFLYIKAVA